MEISHLESLYPTQKYSTCDTKELDGLSNKRIDLTTHNIYTIDPPNCVDADDGFSIKFTDNPDIFNLYVHIADPTTYIEKYDIHFTNAQHNCVTQYPSMNPPRHMLPMGIVTQSSLMNGKKPAITIKYVIKDNKCVDRCLFFSYIYCDQKYKHTYESASELIDHNDVISYSLKASTILSNERNKKFSSLSDMGMSYVYFDESSQSFKFKTYTEKVMILKNMIAELAIASNSYVAQLIHTFNNDYTFTRNCIDNGAKESSNANDTLASIIKNGIRAKYDADNISHDIVGSKLYTHFTSPIRRFSDIIVHFIIKDIFTQQPSFTKDELIVLSNTINKKNKQIQNIQRLESKYRLYQTIKQLVDNNDISVTIKYRFMSYSGLFVNLIIERVNEYNVYASYTIRCKPSLYIGKSFVENQIYSFRCTICNLPTNKFDTNVFPELEKEFVNM